jgi:hypothetical protein
MKVLPAPGVEGQVLVDSLLDVLRQGDSSFEAAFSFHPGRPAPVTSEDRGDSQVPDLAHAQASPRQDEQQRMILRAFRLASIRGVDQPNNFLRCQGTDDREFQVYGPGLSSLLLHKIISVRDDVLDGHFRRDLTDE